MKIEKLMNILKGIWFAVLLHYAVILRYIVILHYCNLTLM